MLRLLQQRCRASQASWFLTSSRMQWLASLAFSDTFQDVRQSLWPMSRKRCQLNFQKHYTILEQYGTIITKAPAGLTWVQSPGYLDLGNCCLMKHCSEWEASLLNDLMSREQQFLCLKHSDWTGRHASLPLPQSHHDAWLVPGLARSHGQRF